MMTGSVIAVSFLHTADADFCRGAGGSGSGFGSGTGSGSGTGVAVTGSGTGFAVRVSVTGAGFVVREHSYMTSDVFRAFLTYLPTLIRYFTT